MQTYDISMQTRRSIKRSLVLTNTWQIRLSSHLKVSDRVFDMPITKEKAMDALQKIKKIKRV